MRLSQTITLDEERSLIRKGTKRSLDKLALSNMSEAIIYARHCSRGGLNDGELTSMCWVALRQAAKNYCRRKSNGITFFAFSKQYLRGQISKEFKARLVVRQAEHCPIDFITPGESGKLDPDHGNALVPTVCEIDTSNLETKELLAGLRPAIFRVLNDRERAIFILRYESGFSFGEIGERIGYSRQHIQNLHSCALKKLRVVLEPKKDQLL